ncbi:autotransporter domain-containing protein [Neptuniibacter sp.]|uniref:autotransporter domain-containing protein n=1 Tax=Neptuniibacter sp. TaxID=1962643 RepID=UPI00261B1AA3|nr:autotransporter domain-containing protein [Neptuniibacter sp.]MCP4596913.1 autotransporter domain-containing protein [Neptuniibacter sp.]
MRNKLYTAICAAGLTTAMLSTGVQANGHFYALGDSLTDNGNLLRDFGHEPAIAGLLGLQATQGYAGGRALNGPTWAEYLPGKTGLSFSTEDDYAYGGATSGTNGLVDGLLSSGETGFLTQLSQFQSDVNQLSADDVVGIWIGTNDTHPAAAAGVDPEITAANVINNISSGLDSIQAMGGRNVVLISLFDMAEIDAAGPEINYPDYDNNIATKTSQLINQGLTELNLDGVNIHYLDLFTLVQRVQADPAAYGYISGVATNACVHNNCGELTLEQQNQYLWMDLIHFTTKFEETIADYAANLISAGSISALQADTAIAVTDRFQQSLLTQLRGGASGWYEESGYQWFITPGFGRTEQQSSGLGVAESETNLTSISGGVSFAVSESTHVGFAANYSNSDSDLSKNYGSNELDSLQLAAFVSHQQGSFFVDAGLSTSMGDLELERRGVFDDLKADPSTSAMGAFAQTGYLFDVGEQGFKLGPIASIRYTDLTVDDYVESGDSLLTIGVEEQSMEQLTLALGLQLQSPVSDQRSYQLQLAAEYQDKDGRQLDYFQTNVSDRMLRETVKGDDDVYARLTGSVSFPMGKASAVTISGTTTGGRDQGEDTSIHASFNLSF